MKDEIKEILECIKDKKRDYVGTNGCLYQDLERKELNLLLDYITNLQEENERLKELNVCVGCNDNPDYKSRIEKAIEYIKAAKDISKMNIPSEFYKYEKHLTDILQGIDEE